MESCSLVCSSRPLRESVLLLFFSFIFFYFSRKLFLFLFSFDIISLLQTEFPRPVVCLQKHQWHSPVSFVEICERKLFGEELNILSLNMEKFVR